MTVLWVLIRTFLIGLSGLTFMAGVSVGLLPGLCLRKFMKRRKDWAETFLYSVLKPLEEARRVDILTKVLAQLALEQLKDTDPAIERNQRLVTARAKKARTQN